MFRSLLFAFLLSLLPESETPPDDEGRMDELFEELRAAERAEDAAFIAEEIEARWATSGEGTADLLAGRAETALVAGDLALARRLADGALEFDEGHVEAWVLSAQIAYADDDVVRAVEDVNRALLLEPRHYGALVHLGEVFERLEQPAGAYDAYQRALEIYPLHPDAAERAREVEIPARGRPL